MTFLKRISPFETALVAVILGAHLYIAFSDAFNFPNAWFARDDAYYYFKVAQNITEGHGVTFDGINPTNGFHPLWMLVCIPIFALARFDLILPLRVLLVVVAAIQACTAVLIYRLARRAVSEAAAILAASFWAFNAPIHYAVYEFGLETPLAALFIVLLLYRLSKLDIPSLHAHDGESKSLSNDSDMNARRSVIVLAVIATLTMFSRLDLVFLAALVGAWIIFRGSPIRFLLPLDMAIIFASIASSVALRTGFASYYLYINSVVAATLIALVAKIPALYFFGAYQRVRSKPIYRTILQSAAALSVASAILFGTLYLFVKNISRMALVYDFAFSLAGILFVRILALWFGNREADAKPRPAWTRWFKEGALFYGILGGSLFVYMLFNKIFFGTSSPVSGQIKRWWGSMNDTIYGDPPQDWRAFFGFHHEWEFNAWRPFANYLMDIAPRLRPLIPGAGKMDERYYFLVAVCVAIAFVILILNPKRVRFAATRLGLIPLAAGSVIHILTYTATGYAGVKEWYWVSQMIFATLTISLLLDLVLRPLNRIRATRWALIGASALIGAMMAQNLADQLFSKMPHGYFAPDRPYMDVVAFLEANTPEGSVIGMTGGGNVGYFIKGRTIVNMDGLINSYDYFLALKRGEAPKYLREKGMDIVFVNPGLLALPPYNGQFDPYLERFGEYGGKALLYLLAEAKY